MNVVCSAGLAGPGIAPDCETTLGPLDTVWIGCLVSQTVVRGEGSYFQKVNEVCYWAMDPLWGNSNPLRILLVVSFGCQHENYDHSVVEENVLDSDHMGGISEFPRT